MTRLEYQYNNGQQLLNLKEVKSECNQCTDHTDDELVALITKHRDKDALAGLYHRYWHDITLFLKRRVSERSEIDKIYRSIMLTVWNQTESNNGKSKVSVWLYHEANKRRFDYICNLKKTEQSNNRLFCKEQKNGCDQRDMTGVLSEKNKTMIELSYFHGFTMTEIASIVGCSLDTVKSRLFYARQKLKKTL